MKTRMPFIVGCAALASVGLGVLALQAGGTRGRVTDPIGEARASAAGETPDDAAGAAATSEEVRRLRAALRQKDEQIRGLLSREAARPSQPQPEPVEERRAPEPPAAPDPAAEAQRTLDARLSGSPADPGRARELDDALGEALQGSAGPNAEGDGKIASRQCSGSMCKVALTGDSPDAAARSASAVMERMPKIFAAAVMYAPRPTERTIYVARSGEELATEPLTDPSTPALVAK